MSINIKCSNIIFIHGISSVGKSTVGGLLQEMMDEPYLRIGFDTFIKNMPKDFIAFDKSEHYGMCFNQNDVNGQTFAELSFGTSGTALLNAMPSVFKALADAGNSLIVEICLSPIDMGNKFFDALEGHNVFFVELYAPLEIIEQREKARGDRLPGTARYLYFNMQDREFDLSIDTAKMDPKGIALMIKEKVSLTFAAGHERQFEASCEDLSRS